MDRRKFSRCVGGHVWKSAVSVAADTRTVHCLDTQIDLFRGRDAGTTAESAHRDLVVVSTRNGRLGDWADGTAGALEAAVNVRRCGFTRIDFFMCKATECDHFVVSKAR